MGCPRSIYTNQNLSNDSIGVIVKNPWIWCYVCQLHEAIKGLSVDAFRLVKRVGVIFVRLMEADWG